MIVGAILIILSTLEFLLGIYFIVRYQKGPTSIFFGFFAIGSAVYVGSNGFGYVGWPYGPEWAERLAWTGGALGTACFLPFSFNFPIVRSRIRTLLPLVVWPAVLFSYGFLGTNAFISIGKTVPVYELGYRIFVGPMLYIFLLFLFVYWMWSLINLFFAHRISDGVHRWQLKMVIAGTLISVIATLSFDVIIPLVTVTNLGYVGSLLTSAWLGFTSYVLVKS